MRRTGLILLGMLFVLLWSSGWTASKFAIVDSSALSILSARYTVLLIVLLMLVSALRQWQRVSTKQIACHLVIGGLCHALYLLGSISAFELGVSAAAVAFINALQPMATASLSGVITGESLQSRQLKGLVLGLASVLLIVSDSYLHAGVSMVALALPFCAMVALTTGMVINRRLEIAQRATHKAPTPVLLILLLHCTGALLVILPAAVYSDKYHWQFSSSEWAAILWLAIAVSLGSYAVLLLLLRILSAVRVSALTYLVPPATILQSYLFFDVAVSLSDIAALAIAGVAVYLILTNSAKQTDSTSILTSSASVARYRLKRVIVHRF